MHPSTAQYLKPTDTQLDEMQAMREFGNTYLEKMEELLPSGPDKTYAIRKFREVMMWANITITRLPDGTPRT
jgi:hypothetical protein